MTWPIKKLGKTKSRTLLRPAESGTTEGQGN